MAHRGRGLDLAAVLRHRRAVQPHVGRERGHDAAADPGDADAEGRVRQGRQLDAPSCPTGTSLLVSLRPIEATEDLILHPVGVLKVSQRAVPLDLELDKVGNQRPTDAKRFTIERARRRARQARRRQGVVRHRAVQGPERRRQAQLAGLREAELRRRAGDVGPHDRVALARSSAWCATRRSSSTTTSRATCGASSASRSRCSPTSWPATPPAARRCRRRRKLQKAPVDQKIGITDAGLRRRFQRRQHGLRRDGDVHQPRRRPGLPRRRDAAVAGAGGCCT